MEKIHLARRGLPPPLSGVGLVFWGVSPEFRYAPLRAIILRASGAIRVFAVPAAPAVYLFVFARPAPDNYAMSDHVYKKIELVGSSPNSIEEAVVNALARAQKTIRNMRWFEVVETRGHIEDGKINHWQVTVKVGFTLDQ